MKSLNRTQVLFVVALWISAITNFGTVKGFFLAPSAGDGLTPLLFTFGGLLIVFFTIYGLLFSGSLLFWGCSVKMWCAIVLIIASVLSYFTFYLGMQFDKAMLINTLQTNASEAMELVTFRLFLWVSFLGFLPAVCVFRLKIAVSNSRLISCLHSFGVLGAVLVALSLIVYSMYPRYASAIRNKAVSFHTIAPVNAVAAAVDYGYSMKALATVRVPVGKDARQSHVLSKPRLFVLVIGETARAKNHGVNGYDRDTTPRMKAENESGFYFRDTESCGTATAISLPCIFSGISRTEFTLSKGRSIETLIDVVLRGGIRVIWRENDSGCKGVCANAEYEDFTSSKNTLWCHSNDNCFDEILLEGLETKVRLQPRDTMVVLHLKGSHGPAYYKRYPSMFERFKPSCQTNDLAACDVLSIRNAYDNTILYSDHVIGRTIDLLKNVSDQFATALMYVSDHGESLGENGLFLHGLPLAVAPKEQTEVPMFAWVSPDFVRLEKWSRDCMLQQTKVRRSHDNVYSTVLGFLAISTVQYKADLDLFGSCY
jgi:lipid A ethanolaminephosphotransferase